MGKNYRTHSKVAFRPRRIYEKDRLDAEMKILGEFGLRCKKEIWRVQHQLSQIRSIARTLLTLPAKHPKRVFEGEALLRRLTRLGVLSESEQKLDFVLSLTASKFFERRLQTRVLRAGLAKSIHHARVLIRHRHIRVGKRLCNIPSFMVRLDSEKHIEFSPISPLGGGRAGRVKRKRERERKGKESGGAEEEEI